MKRRFAKITAPIGELVTDLAASGGGSSATLSRSRRVGRRRGHGGQHDRGGGAANGATALVRAHEVEDEGATKTSFGRLSLDDVKDTLEGVLQQQRDQQIRAALTTWIDTKTWPESAAYLTAHADELLTGDAAQILTTAVATQPDLLRYLGLLELASLIGVEQAHSLITDPDAEPPTSADTLLPLARLTAGLHDDSADAHFTHAVTALRAGLTDEATWAMHRCRDASASWERPAFQRRLDDLAPDLDVTPLITALNASTPAQDPTVG